MARQAKPKPEYTVIRDTREQKGWDFEAQEFDKAICNGTIRETMQTGDYTIQGYESILCVERKATTGEIAQNLVDPRFEREMARLKLIRWRLIVCEFTMEDVFDFPARSGIPGTKRELLRVTPQFLMKRLNEIIVNHKIPIIFAGRKGKEFTASFFRRMIENVKPEEFVRA